MRVTRTLVAVLTVALFSSPVLAQVNIPGAAAPLPGSPGNGLTGQAWQCSTGLGSIANAEACQAAAPALSFLATRVDMANGSSGRTLAQFIGGNGTNFSGDATGDVNQSSWLFSGFLRVDQAGTERFQVTSDDGFRLRIGGVDVMAFDGNRGCGSSAQDASFASAGLYAIELLYWENGGSSCVQLASGAPTGPLAPVPTDRLYTTAVSAVPEPATVALFATGLVGVAAAARRRRTA